MSPEEVITSWDSAVGGVSARDVRSTVLLIGLYAGVMAVDEGLLLRLDWASDDAEGRLYSRCNWVDVGLVSGLDGPSRCLSIRSAKPKVR